MVKRFFVFYSSKYLFSSLAWYSLRNLFRSFLDIYIFSWNISRSFIITKPSIKRVFSYFINFIVKLFLDTAFLNLFIISILLIFNVIVSLTRYNRFLDLNQAVLIVFNRLLSIWLYRIYSSLLIIRIGRVCFSAYLSK